MTSAVGILVVCVCVCVCGCFAVVAVVGVLRIWITGKVKVRLVKVGIRVSWR